MAEVSSEEISSCGKDSIVGNILSFSPLAFVNASSSIISMDALVNKINILSQIFWSAVIVFWDQVGTDVPDALRSTRNRGSRAFGSVGLRDTLSPLSFSGLDCSILNWVAEFSSQESWWVWSSASWAFPVASSLTPISGSGSTHWWSASGWWSTNCN